MNAIRTKRFWQSSFKGRRNSACEKTAKGNGVKLLRNLNFDYGYEWYDIKNTLEISFKTNFLYVFSIRTYWEKHFGWISDLAISAPSVDICGSNFWIERKNLFLLITSWQPLRCGYMTSEWLASRFQFSARLLGRLSLLVKCTDSITEALPLDKLKYRSGHANYKFDVVLISTTSSHCTQG